MKKPADEKQINKMLNTISYKDQPLPDNFEKEFHEKLLSLSNPQPERSYLIPITVFAFALVFAAGFLFGNFFKKENLSPLKDNPSHSAVIANVAVITGDTLTIKLVYDADTKINDVNFTISLPKGLTFHSDNTEISSARSIEWSGTLQKGRNEIPFVVKAKSSGKWLIKASALFNSGELTHEITVKADPGVTNSKKEMENV